MTGEKMYLRGNVLAEPLFNQWYAWPLLIPPASAAMFVANFHLKVMQSFISAPQMHQAALKNPAMRGGPFIGYDESRVPEIKALLERTTRAQAQLLELAAAIQQLDELLTREASGASLEPLYAQVPDMLRGYVELVYDLNHSPSIRFIEGLLYKSPYYDRAAQTMALSLSTGDERPFALSTPLLLDDAHLSLRVPFDAPALDALFQLKLEPQPPGYLHELFGLDARERELFARFLTTDAPRRTSRYTGDAVRIRYLGHASLLIETRETSILIDPVLSYETSAGLYRYTYADLPERIDYVLITHNHQDHCMFETLLQLRPRIGQIIVPRSGGGTLPDPSLKLILQQIGFARVSEIDELEVIEIAGGTLTGVPFLGEHADLNIRTKIAHLINLKGRTILCAADSNNVEPRLYEHIRQLIGSVDVLFLGMECDGGPLSWLYGPLMTRPLARRQDQSRRLNGSDCDRGLSIVNCLHPTQVYVYAMGQEPWLTYLTSIQYTPESRPIVESNRLVNVCRTRGIESERLFGHKEIGI
ncbi:MAG TPA: MBL fold metallo-hydrolase [Pyrinomonadaceae bacterium]|jgi:L-ascorbate metabolism protein UlaG (beta-lactamase superfamily)